MPIPKFLGHVARGFADYLDKIRERQAKSIIAIVVIPILSLGQREGFAHFVEHMADIDRVILRHTGLRRQAIPDP